MRARLKIFCSIMSIVAFFVVSGLILSFAFNISNKNVSAYYSISDGVEAMIYGNYYIGSSQHKMFSGENDHVVFSGTPDDIQESLSPVEDQIDLSTSDGFVVFEYELVNLSDSKNFMVELLATPVTNNMIVSFGHSSEQLSDFNSITSDEFETSPVLAGSGNEVFVYIKVAIDNFANDASYTGTFSFRLFTCEVSEVTLESEGETTCSFYAIYGDEMSPVEVPELDGKQFMGYFTAENGLGTQVIDETGDFLDIWLFHQSEMTLYAYYI